MSKKRSFNHLNQHNEPEWKKPRKSISSNLFVEDIRDQQQFKQIFNYITASGVIKSQLIIKNIAEFSTGRFEQCANEQCLQEISLLHLNENNHKEKYVTHYKCEWGPDQYLCDDCISLLKRITNIFICYSKKQKLQSLNNFGIKSISDVEKYRHKRYLLYHTADLSIATIDALFVDCENEPGVVSECINDQFVNENDSAIPIWDVPSFPLPKRSHENNSMNENHIFVELKKRLPDIIKQISPKQLDLSCFSERHGSLLFNVCATGNFELVEYFIKQHKLNPHYVYPTNMNIMFCVSSYRSRDQQMSQVLKYLAGLGCNMELMSVNGRTCRSFVDNDDAAIPAHANTKTLLSFGFDLNDIAQTFEENYCDSDGKKVRTIRERIFGVGTRCNVDNEFGQIKLLKPKNSMNKRVLDNTKEIMHKLISNMYGGNLSNVINETIFDWLTIRDVTNVYQYTVNKNEWNKKMNCDFLQ